MEQTQEIRVCMDIGSEQHHVIIGLSTGERLEELVVNHKPDEIDKFLTKIEDYERKLGLPVAVAMEAYNGYARPIDKYVLRKGYRLLNVNNNKLAQFKRIFPGPAKSDPIDTQKIFELFTLSEHLPIAKTVLQEVFLPAEINDKIKCLSRRRRTLVNEQTRLSNRMQSDLHAIAPGLLEITGNLCNVWFLHFLTARDDIRKLAKLQGKSLLKLKGIGSKYAAKIQHWQEGKHLFSDEAAWMGPMVVSDANRFLALQSEVKQLEDKIESFLSQSEIGQQLKSIPGFGTVSCGELTGEIGDIKRFKKESSLALYLGMAVLDNSSGRYQGCKVSRHVNKRAKAAMMNAVARHIDHTPEAKCYYDKKRAEGKRHNQAIRSLGRHLCRVIFSMLTENRAYKPKA